MATGRTVGVVGAGQLARMMAQAAIPLDIRLVLLAADANDGAAQVVRDVIVGSPDDPIKVRELAQASDVITFDHELVDPEFLATLESEGYTVYPSAATMALAQNKRRQRAELSAIGLPVPAFADVDSVEDVIAFGDIQGWPVVLKASRGGYDGRGVWMLDDASAAMAAVAEAHTAGLTLLVEERVPLDLELAVLTARRPNGDIAIWEPIETVQRNGMCNELVVPVQTESRIAAEAVSIARRIVEHIEPVGVMAIEFFVSGGRVLINELAPRPHNSGHWTIEGSQTSQFEQHLRAVLDLPLGDTARMAPVIATENLLGPANGTDPTDVLAHALLIHGAHVHFYGKGARPGRKLGHVTVLGDDRAETRQRASLAIQQLTGEFRS
ncbi:MAG: 5-(carboxyamino)imidazole ribonucleotide synthase [Thermomicrobiales bacterium]|nr:5-(carboxyamino)imidazole ribonucleotide synthase [Thermomicrobiales bacterium]